MHDHEIVCDSCVSAVPHVGCLSSALFKFYRMLKKQLLNVLKQL